MTLLEDVAQAIRIRDGNHDKSAAEVAEIALTAVSRHFEEKADSSLLTERVLYLFAADWTRPEAQE